MQVQVLVNGNQVATVSPTTYSGPLRVFCWSLLWRSKIQPTAASPYKVDFQLAAPINKSAKLKLETSLDPKHFTLAYPRRLELCTTKSQP